MLLSLSHKKKRYKVDLPAQLAECELNYHRLLRLFHGLKELAVGSSRQYIVGDQLKSESHFRITVLEQTKYTTVVHIAQLFSLQNPRTSIKNSALATNKKGCMKQGSTIYQGDVRLYHDADVAEVVKCQRYQSFSPRYEYPNIDMHQVDEKAQMNRFLGELLKHCMSHGRVADKVFFSS
jgi:uncharacterized protein YqiB (DUF1249 family)